MPPNLPETNAACAAALCSPQQLQTTTNNSKDILTSNSTLSEGKSLITSLSNTMKQQRLASMSPVPSCTHIIDSFQGNHSNIKENNTMGHPFDANFVFSHTLVSVSVLDSNDNTCNAKQICENMQTENLPEDTHTTHCLGRAKSFPVIEMVQSS